MVLVYNVLHIINCFRLNKIFTAQIYKIFYNMKHFVKFITKKRREGRDVQVFIRETRMATVRMVTVRMVTVRMATIQPPQRL